MNRGIVIGRALAVPWYIGRALARPRRAGGITLGRILVIPLFFLLLEVLVRGGLLDPLFVAAPSDFLRALVVRMAGGELLLLTGRTLAEFGVGFAVCAIVGLPMGYLFWRLPVAGRAYEPLLGGILASPTILLYPVFLIFFGRTAGAIIALIAVHATIPIVLNTRQALEEVSSTFIKVGRSLNLSERQIFRHILLPAAVPIIFAGLRLGIIYMLLGIIALEFIIGIGGLGWFISEVGFRFDAPALYAGIAMVFMLSVSVMYFLNRAQRSLR
ncbi:MAG: ABC transporter permease [Dehalococcoidia bacterium]